MFPEITVEAEYEVEKTLNKTKGYLGVHNDAIGNKEEML